MFERFTDNARASVAFAREEAGALGHAYIGTEHLLLGLQRERDGAAARALEQLGITLERTRAEVTQLVPPTNNVIHGQVPFTPRAKKVLELGLREALRNGQNHVGTEHLLAAIVDEADGIAARVLSSLGADAGTIRRQIVAATRAPEHASQPQGAARSIDHEFGEVCVGPAGDARNLFLSAAARALEAGRTRFETTDLLLAMFRDPTTASLLAELGVDESATRRAIDRSRSGGEPPENTPSS